MAVPSFPGWETDKSDSIREIIYHLPVYMGLLSSELHLITAPTPPLNVTKSSSKWTTSLELVEGRLFVDHRLFSADSIILTDSSFIDFLRMRLTVLRAIGLPIEVINSRRHGLMPSVNVQVRGRNIVELPFTLNNWMTTLDRIAHERQLYAGLLGIADNGSNFSVRYYLVITSPGSMGHHFIEWSEHASKVGEEWTLESIDIKLIPHIRTDNLKDLFASPVDPGRTPVEVHIR